MSARSNLYERASASRQPDALREEELTAAPQVLRELDDCAHCQAYRQRVPARKKERGRHEYWNGVHVGLTGTDPCPGPRARWQQRRSTALHPALRETNS